MLKAFLVSIFLILSTHSAQAGCDIFEIQKLPSVHNKSLYELHQLSNQLVDIINNSESTPFQRSMANFVWTKIENDSLDLILDFRSIKTDLEDGIKELVATYRPIVEQIKRGFLSRQLQ